MSLSKAIEHGKEHRKEYRKSKRFDKTCRNHGGCKWCQGNREHHNKVRELKYTGDIDSVNEEVEPISVLDILVNRCVEAVYNQDEKYYTYVNVITGQVFYELEEAVTETRKCIIKELGLED